VRAILGVEHVDTSKTRAQLASLVQRTQSKANPGGMAPRGFQVEGGGEAAEADRTQWGMLEGLLRDVGDPEALRQLSGERYRAWIGRRASTLPAKPWRHPASEAWTLGGCQCEIQFSKL
jgi:hypothetical protein